MAKDKLLWNWHGDHPLGCSVCLKHSLMSRTGISFVCIVFVPLILPMYICYPFSLDWCKTFQVVLDSQLSTVLAFGSIFLLYGNNFPPIEILRWYFYSRLPITSLLFLWLFSGQNAFTKRLFQTKCISRSLRWCSWWGVLRRWWCFISLAQFSFFMLSILPGSNLIIL